MNNSLILIVNYFEGKNDFLFRKPTNDKQEKKKIFYYLDFNTQLKFFVIFQKKKIFSIEGCRVDFTISVEMHSKMLFFFSLQTEVVVISCYCSQNGVKIAK